jgi:DNA-binding response OmpR family regulator
VKHVGLAIVEGEPRFGRELARFFDEHGFTTELQGDIGALLACLPVRPPRMVLLGVGEEVTPALSALRRLRDVSLLPCILLTCRSDDVSAVLAMEAGADDVACRSTPLRLLLARMRAVLRRGEWGTVEEVPAVSLGGWRLVPQRRQLLRPDGSECPLTTAEFDLMCLLMDQRGRAVPRDAIAQAVFRRPFRAEDRTVDNLVLRLRRKLGPMQGNSIKTVRGAGYMFGGFAEGGLRVA